jgi:hypothetical protein
VGKCLTFVRQIFREHESPGCVQMRQRGDVPSSHHSLSGDFAYLPAGLFDPSAHGLAHRPEPRHVGGVFYAAEDVAYHHVVRDSGDGALGFFGDGDGGDLGDGDGHRLELGVFALRTGCGHFLADSGGLEEKRESRGRREGERNANGTIQYVKNVMTKINVPKRPWIIAKSVQDSKSSLIKS